MKSSAAQLNALAKKIILGPLYLYQATFSPDHGLVNLGGGQMRCRFFPSCSEYAICAVRQYGLLRGFMLTAKRIARCFPGSAGGYDPVPKNFNILGRK